MKDIKNKLQTAGIILLVVCLGLFAINQTLEYKYKAQFLNGPCATCAEQNEDQADCVQGCFEYETAPIGSPINIDYESINLKE